MSGLVSIIMPSYNTGKFIAETIESVMAQTYTDWELIIVDDASTDNTDEVVSSFMSSRTCSATTGCHPESFGKLRTGFAVSVVEGSCPEELNQRIHYIKNEKNSGAAVSRNRALREARGMWIAFLDSDDLWAPDKLEKQIAFMEKNCYAFSYTRYGEMDEDGNKTCVVVGGPAYISKTGMYNYCWPGCLTVMYNREVVGDIQIADIRKNNDYAMWLKIVRKADCHLLAENLATYRKRSGSISNHSYMALVKWHYKLYRDAEGLNPVVSLWITGRNLFFGVWKKIKYVGRG